MNKLFIDTATKTLIVGLYKNDEVIDSTIELANRDHSSRLMPAVQVLLQKNNLALNDLDGIFCSKGPGSYTGVRIGVTVAKTLAWTLNKKLYSISSLKVIASKVALKESMFVLPIIDARRGNVFAALYQFDGRRLNERIEDGLYNFNDLLEKVRDEVGNNVTIVGTDVELHTDLLNEFNFKVQTTIDYNNVFKQLNRLDDFCKVDNVHEFVPNYKRLTEAERNLKR
ncbi:tRNA (adenosine(37)-N6)-threonylcarbamoyltransferase complex dimerization subunit type 1 TsaB [Haloplasma contractile]|uniref:DNA-3-methyladenine glycosylase I protein n=1 Tax=Haloplasma contractile SSD-17B TaxID=1033810 RepID=U2FKR2_9MOLU|nr:tRNA (adenosine(37)-N6)-threonylcarbamoyltransferase complex dimerization subunit type 1 TsaB [Haloplasma contractile]ERJ13380.1 DNA-3-methyladenine glycosylase I protein [Haloplasma contractile SSD-17B]